MIEGESTAPERKPLRRLTSEGSRAWVQFALVVFASIFGVYQFWYKERYVPSQRPASLAVSGELEVIGRKGTMSLVRARVRAENKRDVRIYAPALWYTVTGLRLAAKDTSSRIALPDARRQPGERFALHPGMDAGRVVATWRVPGWEVWYEPGDATTNEELFSVPSGAYDALVLKVEWFVMREIDGVAPPQWSVLEDGSLSPLQMIKKANYESDSTATEPFAPDSIPRHRALELSDGMGQNWSVTTLSLLPAPKK
jgi:hypothetical protein